MTNIKRKLKRARQCVRDRKNSLAIPTVENGNRDVTMVDTHLHTRFSDGVAGVKDVEDICRWIGIGACITDHNEVRASLQLRERDRIPTVPALEVGSSEKIELLVYFRNAEDLLDFYRVHIEPYRKRRYYAFLPRSLDCLVEGAREYESLISLPHPFAPLWKNIDHGRKRHPAVFRALGAADGIEVHNAALADRSNDRAWRLCQRLDKIPLGGSDSHTLAGIGDVVVGFNRPVTSGDLFDAMISDEIYGVFSRGNRLFHVSSAWQVVMRHSQKFVVPNGADGRALRERAPQGVIQAWRRAVRV